jgi:hypothetical protein
MISLTDHIQTDMRNLSIGHEVVHDRREPPPSKLSL